MTGRAHLRPFSDLSCDGETALSAKANVRDRYDYLYSTDELEPWVERTGEIASQARDVFVIANNHNLGKAVINAAELEMRLGLNKPRLPHALASR